MFGTGRTIDKDFAKVRFVKAELQTYCGTVTVRVKWKPGVFTDGCGNQTKVLVVESRVVVFRPKARTAWTESLDKIWDGPEIFFAQCFHGAVQGALT